MTHPSTILIINIFISFIIFDYFKLFKIIINYFKLIVIILN